MRIPSAYPCVECKGRKCHVYYGTAGCPWRAKVRATLEAKQQEEKLREEYEAFTTQPFVGRYGYPNVRLSLIQPVNAASAEEALRKDHPRFLAEKSMQTILAERFSTLQPQWERVQVKYHASRAVTTLQAIALARKPVLTHVRLAEKPRLSLQPLSKLPPVGMRAEARKVEEAEHAQPVKALERVADDPDTPAREAVKRLHRAGVDAYRLTSVLSTGMLGVHERRRLVPTRWSITAVDDMLGREAFDTLRDAEPAFLFATGGFMGNHFLILVLKHQRYAYELIEYYTKTTHIMQDYEFNTPRSEYADETAGGYYAVRKSILEALSQYRIRGMILAIRIITPEYAFPLGVWVVRKAAEEAMRKAERLETREALFNRAREALHTLKPGLPLAFFLQHSRVWKEWKAQTSLKGFT